MQELFAEMYERIYEANDELKEATMKVASWLTLFWNEPQIGEAARDAYRQACEFIGFTQGNFDEMFSAFCNLEAAMMDALDACRTNRLEKTQVVTANAA